MVLNQNDVTLDMKKRRFGCRAGKRRQPNLLDALPTPSKSAMEICESRLKLEVHLCSWIES
jgi:hypothetical protein